MSSKWPSILTKTVLFQRIEPDHLQIMLDCLKPAYNKYQKNEILAIAGEKLNGIGILLEGEAIVVKENMAGNRIMMAVLKPGDMFGEMAVFSKEQLWPASVIAQEPGSALYLPSRKLVGECSKTCTWHQTLIVNMLRIISEKGLQLNRQVEYLAMKSMRGKLSAFLLEQYRKVGQPTFLLALNRNELADFLKVSRPSMSRELGRMRDEGLIDFHKSAIRILNPEGLKYAVET